MRSFILSAIIILFGCPPTEAQKEWAPIGAKWYINALSYSSPMYDKWQKYSTMECASDTIVGGYNGRKVGDHIMIQDGYKVYVWWQDTIRLQYDFSLNVGDTTVFDLLHFDPDVRFQSFIVEAIDTLNIDGILLKRFHAIGNDFQEPASCYCWPYVYMEKIGEVGVVVKENAFEYETSDHIPPFIRCYEEDSLLYKVDGFDLDCDYSIPTSLKNPSFGQFVIKPILLKDILFIGRTELSNNEPLFVRLFRSDGQLVSNVEWNSFKTNLEISISQIPAGILFLQIISKEGQFLGVWKFFLN